MRDSSARRLRRFVTAIGLIGCLGAVQPALALTGPVQIPPYGVLVDDSETLPPDDPEYGEQWGQEGGRTFGFTVSLVDDYNQLLWRPTLVNLAFDGEVTADTAEILTFDRIDGGTAVWIGEAAVHVLSAGTYVWIDVDTEFRLTVTDEFGSVVPFTMMPDGLPYVDIRGDLISDSFGAAQFEAKLEMTARMPPYGSTTAICPYSAPEPTSGLFYPALNVYDCLHTDPAYVTPVISEFEYGFFYELDTLSLQDHDEHMEQMVGAVQSTADDIWTYTRFLFEDWPGVIADLRSRHVQTQDGIGALAGTLSAQGSLLNEVSFKIDDLGTTLGSWPDLSGQLDEIQEQVGTLPNLHLLLLLFGVEADEVGLPPDPNLPPFAFVEQVSDLYQQLAALNQSVDTQLAALLAQLQEQQQLIIDLQSQMNSMYTQEQLEEILQATCPGFAETGGSPGPPPR